MSAPNRFPAIRDSVFRIRNHEYTTGMVSAENLATLIEKEISDADSQIEGVSEIASKYIIKCVKAKDRITELKAENERLQKAIIDIATLAIKHPFFVSDGNKLRTLAEELIKEYGAK